MKKLTRKQRFDRERARENRCGAARVMDKIEGRGPLWGEAKFDFPNDRMTVEVDIPHNHAADMLEEVKKFLDMPCSAVPSMAKDWNFGWVCTRIERVKRTSPDTWNLLLVFGDAERKAGFHPTHGSKATISIGGGKPMPITNWQVSNGP